MSVPTPVLAGFGLRALRLSPTAVSDVEHSNNVSLNREQDSLEVRFPPVQELPHFEVKLAILRGERATRGELRQRVYRFSETTKPGNRSIGGVLRTKPLKDRVRGTIDLG